MAKMNDQVPKARLGFSRLNEVFLKIHLHNPTSNLRNKKLALI